MKKFLAQDKKWHRFFKSLDSISIHVRNFAEKCSNLDKNGLLRIESDEGKT